MGRIPILMAVVDLPGDHLAVPASAAFAMALVEFFRPG
jgi:hypothetical protein